MLECAIHPITYRGEGILATVVKQIFAPHYPPIIEYRYKDYH